MAAFGPTELGSGRESVPFALFATEPELAAPRGLVGSARGCNRLRCIKRCLFCLGAHGSAGGAEPVPGRLNLLFVREETRAAVIDSHPNPIIMRPVWATPSSRKVLWSGTPCVACRQRDTTRRVASCHVRASNLGHLQGSAKDGPISSIEFGPQLVGFCLASRAFRDVLPNGPAIPMRRTVADGLDRHIRFLGSALTHFSLL